MTCSLRPLLATLLALTAFAAGPSLASAAPPPPIHHVITIVLENESVATTFGPSSPAPYLAHTLPGLGAYLPRYYGVGHASLDNYIAMISGQAPNADTQSDCQNFDDMVAAGTGAYGQAEGVGCVYPASIPTIATQLSAAGLSWRDYNDGMGADPSREARVCGHPALNGQDHTQGATAKDQYASRHNPFVYFHAIIDNASLCDSHVVNLDALPADLSAPNLANYTFITPNLCNDGHDATCADGTTGGLKRVDQFLRQWVPRILSSTAFRRDGGLLQIIFDEADNSDSTACCGEIAGPGSPRPGIGGPGGGDTGAVLLSPYIRRGTVTQTPYNHYTLLRSDEDLFGLSHLGYAGLPGETSLGADVFACAPPRPGVQFTTARVRGRRLTLYSVGAATLQVSLPGTRRRRGFRLTRTLAPCQSYTFTLPRGRHGRLRIDARSLSGSDQRATVRV